MEPWADLRGGGSHPEELRSLCGEAGGASGEGPAKVNHTGVLISG